MDKLPSNLRKRRTKLIEEIKDQCEHLNNAIDDYNEEIKKIYSSVGYALDDLESKLDKFNKLSKSVVGTLSSEYENKSEEWKGTDEGIRFAEWIDYWETRIDLDDILNSRDIDEPDILEVNWQDDINSIASVEYPDEIPE